MFVNKINYDFGSIENVETKEMSKFIWAIRNFRYYLRERGGYDQSPRFCTGPNKEYQWSLDICMPDSDKNCIGVRIYPFHSNDNFLARLSILDDSDQRYLTRIIPVKGKNSCVENFVLKTDLLNNPKLLPNDELRISCEIGYTFMTNDKSNEETSEKQMFRNIQLEGFKKLLVDEKFSDFKLIVKEKEFRVHRTILAVQSPVFEAMFDTNMRESIVGEAHIDDIEPRIMNKVLRFMYTGEMDDEDSAHKVLVVAEKYQIDSLKLLCENLLIHKLSADNIYDVLRLSDQNNAGNLKEKAIQFFYENLNILCIAENFKTSVNSLSGNLKTAMICSHALKHK